MTKKFELGKLPVVDTPRCNADGLVGVTVLPDAHAGPDVIYDESGEIFMSPRMMDEIIKACSVPRTLPSDPLGVIGVME